MKKRIIIALSIVLCSATFVVIGASSSATNYYNSNNVTKVQKELYNISKNDSKVFGKNWKYDPTNVDEKLISKQADEVAKQSGENKQNLEKDMLRRAVEAKVLYLAATDAGFSASEAEVQKEVDDLRKGIHGIPEEEKNLKAIVDGFEMTEDEYWEMVKPQYETAIIVNKYLDHEYEKRKSKLKGNYDGEKIYQLELKWRQEIINRAKSRYGED